MELVFKSICNKYFYAIPYIAPNNLHILYIIIEDIEVD